MAKKNPIILIPPNSVEDNDILSHLNENVLKTKNGSAVIPSIDMYLTQTGKIFKVNENNTMEEMYQAYDKDGYLRVSYYDTDGKRHRLYVHRAVLATFSPISKKKMNTMVVNHKKGEEKDNNDINNLEWLTVGDNTRDAFTQGLKRSKHRITDDDIIEIIDLAKAGYDDEYIANIIGSSKGTIIDARTGTGLYKEKIKRLGLEPVKHKVRNRFSK